MSGKKAGQWPRDKGQEFHRIKFKICMLNPMTSNQNDQLFEERFCSNLKRIHQIDFHLNLKTCQMFDHKNEKKVSGSLFSGGGIGDVGIEWGAWNSCDCCCEIDSFQSGVNSKEFS